MTTSSPALPLCCLRTFGVATSTCIIVKIAHQRVEVWVDYVFEKRDHKASSHAHKDGHGSLAEPADLSVFQQAANGQRQNHQSHLHSKVSVYLMAHSVTLQLEQWEATGVQSKRS